MREIKYMAWNHCMNQMRVVSKIDFLMSRVWILNNRREEMHNPWPFSDCILLQYTGLKDKNGKEIYEGDNIDGEGIDGMTVTYCGDQKAGLGMDAGWYLQRDNFESWILLMSRCNENGDNYEVIGNKFENPEPLKTTELGC